MAESGLAKKRRKIEVISNQNALQENIKDDLVKKLMVNCMEGINEESFVKLACEKYKALCMVPKINKGMIIGGQNVGEIDEYSLVSKCSQHDLANKEIKRWQQFMIAKINWKQNSISLDAAPFPLTMQDITLQTVSLDAMFQGIIKKSSKNNKTSYILEVWSKTALNKVINLSSYDKHGDIYNEATFSSFQWSHDCTKLIYIAEKKRENCDSYFDDKKDLNEANMNDEGSRILDKGEKYLYEEDWGEQEVGLCHPVIVMFDTVSEKMEILNCVPNEISPGQCLWGPDNSIICIGWWHKPFRLGVVYCENRRSAIFQVKFDENGANFCQLSNDHCSVQSPRLSPDHSNLIYLERNAGGAHRGCERLMMLDLSSKSTSSKSSNKVIYDIVEVASECRIPIFCQSLPRRCWIENGEYIALQTNFRSDKIIVVIEVKTGHLHRLTHEAGAWSLLDTSENILLASYAAPNIPGTLMIGKFEPGQRKVNWIRIERDPYNMEKILKWEKLVVSHDNDLPENRTESVLIKPMNSASKTPVIVWPHGGPHTCAIADFLSYPALFASLGFAVLLVNYRGSTGFGEKPLKSLLGKIGSQDVVDVQFIAQTAIKTNGFDDKNIFIFGGSHGGFLSAHLIGQFPDSYKACALRNPVINIPSMVEVSDIPDWCYVESGLEYSHEIYPNKETYCMMLEKSPISFSKNVTCPVLVMIGGKDVRVPPSQGRSFYRNLKANGKEARIHWYPDDSHPLNEVETEADVFVNISRWFYKYLD